MSLDRIEAAGLILSVLTSILLCILIAQSSFPVFKYAVSDKHLVEATQPVGPKVSYFMWKNRGMDLIVQAFVLFVSAAACLAILRREEKKGKVEST